MNKYLTLTKVLLKNGSSSFSYGSGKKKMTKTALMWLLMIVAFMPTVIMFTTGVSHMYDSLVMIGQEGTIISLLVGAVSLMVFFFGIFYAISTFFFSSDIQNLLPLPLRPWQILGAKFTVSLIYEYMTEILFLLPVLIMYGIKSSAGILYYIYGAVIYLTLPIIPLSMAAFLDMVVLRFTNIGKNKDRFRVIGGVISLFIALSFSFIMPKFTENSMSQQQLIEMATSGNNSLVGMTAKIFPGSIFAANTLINSENIQGLLNLLIFIVCVAVIVTVFLLIGEKLYFKGVIGMSEAPSKRKKLKEGELNRALIRSSSLKALTLKELRMLIRTPIYFLNCVIMNFLWPVFFILPVVMDSKSSGDFRGIAIFLNGKMSYILLGVFAISLFISPTNMISSTSISREGQNIYVNKYIPVSYRIQIMSKVLSGFILSMAGMLIIIVMAEIFTKMPVYIVFLSIVLAVLSSALANFMGILIDLNFPKLNWDNETKAVKQNFNGVLNMLICVILAGLSVFGILMLHSNLWITFLILGGASFVLDIILYKVLCTLGVEAFEKISA